MPAKVRIAPPEVQLGQLLDSLADDLLGASDEEILAAARELGMNPQMKGSAAFFGIKYATPRIQDFMDIVSLLPERYAQKALHRLPGARKKDPEEH